MATEPESGQQKQYKAALAPVSFDNVYTRYDASSARQKAVNDKDETTASFPAGPNAEFSNGITTNTAPPPIAANDAFPIAWLNPDATKPTVVNGTVVAPQQTLLEQDHLVDIYEAARTGQVSALLSDRQRQELDEATREDMDDLTKGKPTPPPPSDEDEDDDEEKHGGMHWLPEAAAVVATVAALNNSKRHHFFRNLSIVRGFRAATKKAGTTAKAAEKAEKDAKKAKLAAEAAAKNASEMENLARDAAIGSRAAKETALAAERAKEAEKAAKLAREAEKQATIAVERSSIAEQALLNATREKEIAEKALQQAKRMTHIAELAKSKMSGVSRLLSVAGTVGKYNLYTFAGVRIAKALAIYALAPKGQDPAVTQKMAMAVLTRSPFSKEATQEIHDKLYGKAAVTIAKDVARGLRDTAEFAMKLVDAVVNHPDEVKTQIKEVKAQLDWFHELYRKNPDEAQALAGHIMKGILPTSRKEAQEFAFGGFSGDEALQAEHQQKIIARLQANPEAMREATRIMQNAQTMAPLPPRQHSSRVTQPALEPGRPTGKAPTAELAAAPAPTDNG